MWLLDPHYVGRVVAILLEYFTSCRSAWYLASVRKNMSRPEYTQTQNIRKCSFPIKISLHFVLTESFHVFLTVAFVVSGTLRDKTIPFRGHRVCMACCAIMRGTSPPMTATY